VQDFRLPRHCERGLRLSEILRGVRAPETSAANKKAMPHNTSVELRPQIDENILSME
jgi:hypothetical protein